MTENEALQKAIDEYKENLRQEKLRLELSNYSATLRKTIEENVRDIELEIKWLEEIQQFRAIGTIDEFNALKEKNEPKKIIGIDSRMQSLHCPSCNDWFGIEIRKGMKFCPNCGQALET